MTRRTTSLILLALVLALVPTGAGADANGATIDKTGWWNRLNTTVGTDAGPVTVPPPPGIPEGDLAVGFLQGDEPTSVTGIGVKPDDGPGATVTSFTLRLTEDPDAEANQGTDGAVIVACPITDFWAGGPNGDWETRPDADCEAASIAGTRDDSGVWTWDLTPIARLWFDPFGTIIADGVLLLPDVEESAPFQAVFKGGDDVDVELESTPGADQDDAFATPDTTPIQTDSGLSNSGGGDSIFSPDVNTGSTGSDFETPTSPDVVEPPAAPETPEETAAPPLTDTPTTEPVANRSGELLGNLSPLVFLGMLLFVGLLLAMSYWLGPNGQPVTTVRQRGVSRALDARARATKGS